MAIDDDKITAEQGKKLGGLPSWPPGAECTRQQLAYWIGEVLYVTVIGAERWGTSGDTPITVYLDDGREIRWDEQDDLNTLTRLRGPLIRLGIRPRPLSPHSVGLVAWAITRLATLSANVTAKQEAIDWGESYMQARPTRMVSRSNGAQWRKALQDWQEIDDYDPKGPRRAKEARPFVLVDGDDDECYIRRGDFGAHVRARLRGGMSWRKLAGRMAEVDWQQDRLQYGATQAGAPYVQARVFVVPKEWPEDVNGA